jgi:hypothetical protein
MHALNTIDEFIKEGQTRQQVTLSQPRNGDDGAGDAYALHGSKSHQALSKGGMGARNPLEDPPSLYA